MKRLAGPLLALVLAGCADAAPQRLLGPASPRADVSTYTLTDTDPVDLYVDVPCALGGIGETIHLTGSLFVLFHSTMAEDYIVLKTHFSPQQLSGVGLTSGLSYQGTGVTQDVLTLHAGQTYTLVNNFRMIGQGPGNNFLVHENYHLTVNANGEVATERDALSIDCR